MKFDEEQIKEIFSRKLKQFMDANDKTQADLYKYMNVTSSTASDWCNGRKLPRMDKIQRLCEWFRCDPSDLLEDKGKKVQPFEINEMTGIMTEMTEQSRMHLLEYARFLLKRDGDGNEN